jgi:cell division protein FtsA
LQVPFESAEQLKIAWGRALPDPAIDPADDGDDRLQVEGFEGTPRTVSRRTAQEVIEARLEQLLQLVQKELRASGYDGALPGGLVLTGGGALLPDLADLARQVTGLRARIGSPRRLAGLGDSLNGPAFATGVGLARWALRQQATTGVPRRDERGRGRGRRGRNGSGGGFGRWLRELLP